jgi:mercuric ion transport protein
MQLDSPKALAGAALAAIGASLCCLGPLALVSVGVSGAWISNLTALEPYRWVFAAVAVGFMGYASKRIFSGPSAR